MQIKPFLIEQVKNHPSMQPQDVMKLCYQAVYGADHLLDDLDAAEAFFTDEFSITEQSNDSIAEWISPLFGRVNFGAWKSEHLPSEWLFRMFIMTAKKRNSSDTDFIMALDEVQRLTEKSVFPFSLDAWEAFLADYNSESSPHPVHHSEQYREAEHPAYRVIDGRLIRLIPILKRIAALPGSELARCIVIDGRAGSGKTTIAGQLETILNAGVVHMDDFYLPRNLRTPKRYAEPGGNVYYERFSTEVLPFLENREAFEYRIFDCETMNYSDFREVRESNWRIVEGSYSQHPFFGHYGTLRVFIDISPEEQIQRIELRDGAANASVFTKKWIPLEELYFNTFNIAEQSDMVITND